MMRRVLLWLMASGGILMMAVKGQQSLCLHTLAKDAGCIYYDKQTHLDSTASVCF